MEERCKEGDNELINKLGFIIRISYQQLREQKTTIKTAKSHLKQKNSKLLTKDVESPLPSKKPNNLSSGLVEPDLDYIL